MSASVNCIPKTNSSLCRFILYGFNNINVYSLRSTQPVFLTTLDELDEVNRTFRKVFPNCKEVSWHYMVTSGKDFEMQLNILIVVYCSSWGPGGFTSKRTCRQPQPRKPQLTLGG